MVKGGTGFGGYALRQNPAYVDREADRAAGIISSRRHQKSGFWFHSLPAVGRAALQFLPTTLPYCSHSVKAAILTTMNLKNGAFLALIGTILLTILLAADFIKAVSGVLSDIVPAVVLLRSLIYLIASLSVTVFFYVFSRAQSR